MASTSLKNILLVSGGGRSSNLGAYILKALNSEPSFSVTVLSRQSSKTIFPSAQKVIIIPDNFPQSDLVSAFTGQDAVILALPSASGDVDKRCIDAAVTAGVKRILPSEFGSSSKAAVIFPYGAQKLKIEEYLREKERTGLTWAAVKTGLFFDFAIPSGFFGFNIKAHEATIWDDGNYRWSSTTRPQIAKGVVKILLHPQETENKSIHIASFTVSMNEILASFEKATGAKWTKGNVQTGEQIEKANEMMKQGGMTEMMGIATLAQAITYSPGYGADFGADGVLANKMLGLEGEELDVAVKGLVDGYLSS